MASCQKQMTVFLTPISVALAHQARPRKALVSPGAVKLTNTTTSISDGVSPRLFPPELYLSLPPKVSIQMGETYQT